MESVFPTLVNERKATSLKYQRFCRGRSVPDFSLHCGIFDDAAGRAASRTVRYNECM